MGNLKRKISLTGDIKFTGLQLKAPMEVAAGFLGVKEALRHGAKEMGIVRSMNTNPFLGVRLIKL